MVVYHGSNSRFKQLKISKSLAKHNSTVLNEGYGIYFSTDIAVAESYGQYIYTLEINDRVLYNFKTLNLCRIYMKNMIKYIEEYTGVNIQNYLDKDKIETISRNMYSGGLMLCTLYNELRLNLDNEERYFELSETKRKQIERKLKKFNIDTTKAYLFNYSIANIGVIKDVDESIVRIVSVKQR